MTRLLSRLWLSLILCMIYTCASASTLSIFIQSQSSDTRAVEINGVDTGSVSQPFQFDWGDGSSQSSGYFPQPHIYADVSQTYTVTVTATYTGGGTDFKQLSVVFHKTLSVFIQNQSPDTATVEINGVDTGSVTQPFQFDWGDGSQTSGYFPQHHTYSSITQTFTITVTSTYSDGATDSEQVTADIDLVFSNGFE